MKVLKPDPNLMRESLRVLGVGRDHVTELRVLDARFQKGYAPFTFSGYFDDLEALIKEACRVEYAKGWYITLNPLNPDLLSRRSNRADRAGKGETASDGDVLKRTWLPIDLDAVRLSGISATDEEHHVALDRARKIAAHLRGQGWPDPILGGSGNGAHLLYRVDLPRDDGGVVQKCLQALDKRFSDEWVKVDTSVYNSARIWKLYGTPACKGDSTLNRPHRMAKIIGIPNGI
nr:hypothetical protein [uncultured Holophaga sp.]